MAMFYLLLHVYGVGHMEKRASSDSEKKIPLPPLHGLLFPILSISKDLTCTFRATCYSARLSWAIVLTWVSPFVRLTTKGLLYAQPHRQDTPFLPHRLEQNI